MAVVVVQAHPVEDEVGAIGQGNFIEGNCGHGDPRDVVGTSGTSQQNCVEITWSPQLHTLDQRAPLTGRYDHIFHGEQTPEPEMLHVNHSRRERECSAILYPSRVESFAKDHLSQAVTQPAQCRYRRRLGVDQTICLVAQFREMW